MNAQKEAAVYRLACELGKPTGAGEGSVVEDSIVNALSAVYDEGFRNGDLNRQQTRWDHPIVAGFKRALFIFAWLGFWTITCLAGMTKLVQLCGGEPRGDFLGFFGVIFFVAALISMCSFCGGWITDIRR